MKELRGYIDEATGERRQELFDMTQEQIAALEAARAESTAMDTAREEAELAKFKAMADKLGYVATKKV